MINACRAVKVAALVTVAWTWCGRPALAQGASSDAASGWVEGVAQAAFGTATSQSYGAELGYRVVPNIAAFAEIGRVTDMTSSTMSAGAQQIAAFLATMQPNVSYSVREPIAFGMAGGRYQIPIAAGRLEPYVSGEAGIARVKKDVNFLVGGTNVNASLPQFGVVLGSDLGGTATKPVLGFGAGVALPISRLLVLDFQYRFGRIVDANDSININRAGLGVGVRF